MTDEKNKDRITSAMRYKQQANLEDIKKRPYLTAYDVAVLLNRSLAISYVIIRDLNAELKQKGYYTICARVPKKYFCERFNIPIEELAEVKD